MSEERTDERVALIEALHWALEQGCVMFSSNAKIFALRALAARLPALLAAEAECTRLALENVTLAGRERLLLARMAEMEQDDETNPDWLEAELVALCEAQRTLDRAYSLKAWAQVDDAKEALVAVATRVARLARDARAQATTEEGGT